MLADKGYFKSEEIAKCEDAGIPVYGVSGIFVDIDDNRAHGQNERIDIRSFFEGQEFLYRLTKALTQVGT